MDSPIPSLTKYRHLLLALWCVWWLLLPCGVSAENADVLSDYYKDPTGNSRAKNQLLAPLTIDDRYLRKEIPSADTHSTITLRGAVTEAAVHNKEVREARLQVSRFKWDYLAAETNRLPNVRVLSYLTEQTINSLLVPARPNAFVFLSVMFPVTQQYRFGLEARVVKLEHLIASERLRQRLEETSSKIKGAYYKLALDQSLLADIQDSIKYLTELKTTVSDQVKRGNSLKVDEMEVAAKLAKAEYEETKARNSLNVDRERFNQTLGRELNASVTLEAIPPPDELELDVPQAERQALSMRPEIREADAHVRQVDAEKKIIMAGYIPNVSVGLVYIAAPGYNNTIIPQNILAPGIFINWNAWDWGGKALRAKARAKDEQSSSLRANTAREDVIIDLHTQINKLTEARQLVTTTQLARAASREEMRVSLNRYKYTSAKLSDVLEAQSGLAEANNNYHQALLAFWEAKAQFERAIGTDQ
jgi:outer membrane protein